jgi:hypothetical protein
MSLDERQRIVKKTFSKQQLDGMSMEDLVALVGEAGPDAKLHMTAVVKRADGSIKYDGDAVPGEYHETPEELAAHREREAEKELSND